MDRPSSRGGYSTRDVATMLGLSPGQVRSYVRAGSLTPPRGPRGELRFSFQDLVLLRTAQGLVRARVPGRRVRQALRMLKEQLPSGRPLSAVRISADGKQVVARDGRELWNPESGQALFDFEVRDLAREAAPFARRAAREARAHEEELGAEDWYELGCELEATAPEEATDAYRRALALDPAHADANLNLGRILHEDGDLAGAETHYRRALAARPDDATAAFDLGVVLEDLGRLAEAAGAYEAALAADSAYADAHYNLSGVYESLGRKAEALRHLKDYKTLTKGFR
ncbi:MAG TPA: tetratricopeptide repeat protein [Thermoanaerobaculia bacterium]|nr:tetratricopeptide repeat protein [Thermoanaerobaculia bacterium]